MKNFVSILALACLSGSADAAFSATSVTAPSTLDVGETPAAFKFQMTVGTALVATEKIVVTSDKAVWAAAAAATCTIDGTAQTATAAADATMKILTLTMTSGLAAAATVVTCTSNIGVNPAAGAATFTIASFAADGTTVKDAVAPLGSYTTFVFPLGVVQMEYTDNTCATVKAGTYKVFGSYTCGLSAHGFTLGYRPTSATGGEYGVWSSPSDCTGTFTATTTFTYKTSATVNCVTITGTTPTYHTYQTIFPDTTATKVGVDQDLLDDTTCATPQWQGAPLTGACTTATIAGSSFYYKFYPLAAGVLADGGFSASKSVAYAQWTSSATCAGHPDLSYWGGVYSSTSCADTDVTMVNWKFCENAACPAYSSSASTSTVAATVALGAVTAAVLLA